MELTFLISSKLLCFTRVKAFQKLNPIILFLNFDGTLSQRINRFFKNNLVQINYLNIIF